MGRENEGARISRHAQRRPVARYGTFVDRSMARSQQAVLAAVMAQVSFAVQRSHAARPRRFCSTMAAFQVWTPASSRLTCNCLLTATIRAKDLARRGRLARAPSAVLPVLKCGVHLGC